MPSETIVCLSSRLWHSLWRDGQQVMSRLAQTHRIIFVEPIRDPDISFFAHVRTALRYYGAVEVENIMPNLVAVRTPPGVPFARRNLPRPVLKVWYRMAAEINNALIAWHVRRVMRHLKVEQPILWVYDPRQASLVNRLGAKLVVYYNYDEMGDFAPNYRVKDMLEAYDQALCRRADVVFATSRTQQARRVQFNPNTYFCPNGVDHALFSQALKADTPVAPEIAGLPRPVIGLVGWLGYQVDVALLLKLARAYPQASVVLVGPDALVNDDAYRKLKRQPNVTFTGRKELAELPQYLKGFDVALLPYAKTGHTYAIYPLKLHEYLAAGRSVVATDMPEVRAFSSFVRIAPDDETFIRLVAEAINDNAPAQQMERSNLARQHTWDQRVSAIRQTLDKHLQQPAYGLKSHAAGMPAAPGSSGD